MEGWTQVEISHRDTPKAQRQWADLNVQGWRKTQHNKIIDGSKNKPPEVLKSSILNVKQLPAGTCTMMSLKH